MGKNINAKLTLDGKVYGKTQSFSYGVSNLAQKVFDTTFTVDNADALNELVTIDPAGAKLWNKANQIVLSNTGSQTAEVQILVRAFSASTDAVNGSDPYNSKIVMLLKPGDFTVLPSSRLFLYHANTANSDPYNASSAPQSSGNKLTRSFIAPESDGIVQAYAGAIDSVTDTQLDGAMDNNASTVTLTLDSPHMNAFKKYDLVSVGSEIMQITSINSATAATVVRAVLGSSIASHSDDANVSLYFLKDDSVVRTNDGGDYYASSFFAYGRSVASGTNPSGVVPGSVAVKFYTAPFMRSKLFDVTSNTNSQLTASTAYTFKLTVNGSASSLMTITTDAKVLTLGTGNPAGLGVLDKIQAQLDAAGVDVNVGISGGDVVYTARSAHSDGAIAATAPGSGTALWGQGIFPATGSHSSTGAQLPGDEDISSLLLDDGRGNLLRAHGGTGLINYETGACIFSGCPPRADFQVALSYNSALSGYETGTRDNSIATIYARSTNQYRNAKVHVLLIDDNLTDNTIEILAGQPTDDGGFEMDPNPLGGERTSGIRAGNY